MMYLFMVGSDCFLNPGMFPFDTMAISRALLGLLVWTVGGYFFSLGIWRFKKRRRNLLKPDNSLGSLDHK